jgi:hypothetical protein
MAKGNDEAARNKAGKPPVFNGLINYFPRALSEVAKVSAYGAKKHSFDLADLGFLDPRYPIEGMTDAMARHIVALATEGEVNIKDGDVYHRAQVAWNALASLEKILLKEE